MNRKQKMFIKTIVVLIMVVSSIILPSVKEQMYVICAPQMQVEEPIHRRIIAMNKKATQDVHSEINVYVSSICLLYNIEPNLIKSIIYHESRGNPKAENGDCVGLMQISMRWHADRAEKLGVTDFYDPYSNILLGVDYISELFKQYDDPALVLMLYNMKHDDALKMYNEGRISVYAKSVLAMTENYEKGE
jgi:hypothetical protein